MSLINKKQEISKFKHIAVLQTAYLSDIVLSFYLLEKIKEIHPDVKLSFITTKAGADIAVAIESIDNIIVYDEKGLHQNSAGFNLLAKLINKQKVDCLISLNKSYRTTKLAAKIKAKFKVGFDRASLSFLVYDFRQIYHPSLSEIKRNLSLLSAFKIDEISSEIKVKIGFNENVKNETELLLDKFPHSDYIAIAPGSIWETKRWPTQYFAKLIEFMIEKGEKIVLTGAKGDIEICERIEKSIQSEKAAANLKNLAGETNLLQTMYLLSNAKLTITNDSASTHLSEITGTTVAALFGPTSTIFGYAPHLADSKILEVENLNCRPCEIQGNKKCPISTHVCMNNLLPEKVFEKIFINN